MENQKTTRLKFFGIGKILPYMKEVRKLTVIMVIFGLLGEVFPLYLVFAAGTIISLIPMLYLCLHPMTREFILNHCD